MIKSFVLACILLAELHLIESEVITLEKSSGFSSNHYARPLIKSAYQGGKGGRSFDDMGASPMYGVHSISISYRDKVDSIQVTYEWGQNLWGNLVLTRAPRHGILKSRPIKITLDKYERVVRVEGQTNGKYVNQLTIITELNNGRKVYGPFGKNGSLPFSFEGYIVAFFGRCGLLHLNSIGVYSLKSLKKSDMFGGTGGTAFDDAKILQPPAPQFVGISQIKIWSGKVVEAIQVKYAFLGPSFYTAYQHGVQQNGNLTTINFPDGEILVTLEGYTEDDYISQLTFITQKPDGSEGKYGPFGVIGKCPFSFSGNIVAIYGTSGSHINKIGFYYV